MLTNLWGFVDEKSKDDVRIKNGKITIFVSAYAMILTLLKFYFIQYSLKSKARQWLFFIETSGAYENKRTTNVDDSFKGSVLHFLWAQSNKKYINSRVFENKYSMPSFNGGRTLHHIL